MVLISHVYCANCKPNIFSQNESTESFNGIMIINKCLHILSWSHMIFKKIHLFEQTTHFIYWANVCEHFELHVTSNDLEKPCRFDEYIRKVWSVKQNIEFRQEIVEISFDLFMSFTNKLLMITHFRSVHTRSSKHNALSEIYSKNI